MKELTLKQLAAWCGGEMDAALAELTVGLKGYLVTTTRHQRIAGI